YILLILLLSKPLMGKKPIDPVIRAQAVALHGAGLNQVQISKQLKISRSCVQNTIKKYEELFRYNDLKHTGRPKKLSDREVRHLKKLVKGDSRLSAAKIASDLTNSLPKPVTIRTVRRYLKDLGFEYVVKIKKQWLSARHWQQRVAWCTQHLSWTHDDWRKNKRIPVIGIWGGISRFGTTAAKIYTQNMNGQLYCDVLQKELQQSMTKILKKTEIIFQQDLAPWHTSNILKDKIAKLKLKVFDWASKSPALSPIEMLWSILDKKLASKRFISKEP
ncbi:unnamed protein product, partial [Didymodactylos carnosus]